MMSAPHSNDKNIKNYMAECREALLSYGTYAIQLEILINKDDTHKIGESFIQLANYAIDNIPTDELQLIQKQKYTLRLSTLERVNMLEIYGAYDTAVKNYLQVNMICHDSSGERNHEKVASDGSEVYLVVLLHQIWVKAKKLNNQNIPRDFYKKEGWFEDSFLESKKDLILKLKRRANIAIKNFCANLISHGIECIRLHCRASLRESGEYSTAGCKLDAIRNTEDQPLYNFLSSVIKNISTECFSKSENNSVDLTDVCSEEIRVAEEPISPEFKRKCTADSYSAESETNINDNDLTDAILTETELDQPALIDQIDSIPTLVGMNKSYKSRRLDSSLAAPSAINIEETVCRLSDSLLQRDLKDVLHKCDLISPGACNRLAVMMTVDGRHILTKDLEKFAILQQTACAQDSAVMTMSLCGNSCTLPSGKPLHFNSKFQSGSSVLAAHGIKLSHIFFDDNNSRTLAYAESCFRDGKTFAGAIISYLPILSDDAIIAFPKVWARLFKESETKQLSCHFRLSIVDSDTSDPWLHSAELYKRVTDRYRSGSKHESQRDYFFCNLTRLKPNSSSNGDWSILSVKLCKKRKLRKSKRVKLQQKIQKTLGCVDDSAFDKIISEGFWSNVISGKIFTISQESQSWERLLTKLESSKISFDDLVFQNDLAKCIISSYDAMTLLQMLRVILKMGTEEIFYISFGNGYCEPILFMTILRMLNIPFNYIGYHSAEEETNACKSAYTSVFGNDSNDFKYSIEFKTCDIMDLQIRSTNSEILHSANSHLILSVNMQVVQYDTFLMMNLVELASSSKKTILFSTSSKREYFPCFRGSHHYNYASKEKRQQLIHGSSFKETGAYLYVSVLVLPRISELEKSAFMYEMISELKSHILDQFINESLKLFLADADTKTFTMPSLPALVLPRITKHISSPTNLILTPDEDLKEFFFSACDKMFSRLEEYKTYLCMIFSIFSHINQHNQFIIKLKISCLDQQNCEDSNDDEDTQFNSSAGSDCDWIQSGEDSISDSSSESD